jgi:YHS domain-containing protein
MAMTKFFLAFSLLLGAALSSAQAAEEAAQPSAVEKTATAAQPLAVVEAKRVCMVNDQTFEKDQIPVEIEGRTYYGCCVMCKERLAQDAAMRTGVDPISGNDVDKAAAVIGALPDGTVLYFESEANLAQYNALAQM